MTENQQFLSTQNYLDLTPSQQQLLADMQREYAEGMRLLNTIDRSVTVYGGSKFYPAIQITNKFVKLEHFLLSWVGG